MPEPTVNPVTPYQRLQQGPRRRVVIGVLVGLFLLMVIPGLFSLWFALCGSQTTTQRAIFLLIATVALALPARIIWISCRRKLKTGQWSPSPEERRQLRAKSAGKTLPKWLNPVMAFAYILVTVVVAVTAVRKPFDIWNYAFLPVWTALAAQSLWQMVRDYRKARPTA